MQRKTLWQQHSNTVSSFLNFAAAVAQAIGLIPITFTFILTAVGVVGGIRWLGIFFSVSLAVFTYLLLKKGFEKAAMRTSLRYSMDDEGINFIYQFRGERKISFPFESILKANFVTLKDIATTHRVYFHMIPEVDVSDYAAFTDDEVHLICFDDIKEIELVNKILAEKIVPKESSLAINYPSPNQPYTTSRFSIVINAIGFLYMLLSFYIMLSTVDMYLLEPKHLVDHVTHEEPILYGLEVSKNSRKITTENGYVFNANVPTGELSDKINLSVSPWFNFVVAASSDNSSYEIRDISYDNQLAIFARFVAAILLLFCSAYMVHKNGDIPLADTLLFIVFPLVVLLIAIYI